jgi:hypothetical protein
MTNALSPGASTAGVSAAGVSAAGAGSAAGAAGVAGVSFAHAAIRVKSNTADNKDAKTFFIFPFI